MSRSSGLRRATAISMALLAALVLVLALWGAKPAEAAFPGGDGSIAFVSTMGTSTGANDPAGDFEVFVGQTSLPFSLQQLTHNGAEDLGPAWSPNGDKIAFSSNRDGDHEIYTMDAGGSNLTPLTNNSVFDSSPSWSPDGKRIVFTRLEGGDFNLYLMNADGSSDPRRITKNTAWDLAPAWSPDGKKIAFQSLRIGGSPYEIFTMKPSPEGRRNRPVNITRHSTASDETPNWSPDSKQLAFTSCRGVVNAGGSNCEIYKVNVDGSNLTPLTRNNVIDFDPVWSPSGGRIVFTREPFTGNSELYVINADGSGESRITNNSPVVDQEPDWQPIN